MAARTARRTSNNLVLAALLALLSYVPFEYLAKFSLLVAAGLFIVDPLPPYTRLLALGLVLFVCFSLASNRTGKRTKKVKR